MPAPLLIAAAAFLFAVMGLCVKLASAQYGSGEIVFYRALIGMLLMAVLVHRSGGTLRTRVPSMHFWRSASGVAALCLWFYALGGLPLATAMTMNYMSSVWMAMFLVGGAILAGATRVDPRLVAAVLAGFAGVALILKPTIDQRQAWYGLAGLASGVLSALAYLQVTALGRAGENEQRVVFYFSLGGVVAGGAIMMAQGGPSPHTVKGALLLVAIGALASCAQLLMTRAYAIGSALVNAALQYLGIVWSFIFGVCLFDDPVTVGAITGMLLIVGAGLTATVLSRRAHTPANPPTET